MYLGSKDIDLGFHIDPHWTESEIQGSELLKVIGILEEKLHFEPFGSFRFAKSYDIQTQRELTKQEQRTKESFNIHHLFVDLLVDNSNSNLDSVLGFSPIDESLLTHYFSDSKNRNVISLDNTKVSIPFAPLLLAMKVRTIPRRKETHKRVKDVADSFALLRYSNLSFDALKKDILRFIDATTIRTALHQISPSIYQQVSDVLGIATSEIRSVLYGLLQ